MRIEKEGLYLLAVIVYIVCLFVLIVKKKWNFMEHIVFLLGFSSIVVKLKSAFPLALYVYEGSRNYRSFIPFKNIFFSYESSVFLRIVLISMILSVVLGFCIKYLFYADSFPKVFLRFAIVGLTADAFIIAARLITNDGRPYDTSVFVFDILGFVLGYFIALLFKKTTVAITDHAKKPNKERTFNDLYQD